MNFITANYVPITPVKPTNLEKLLLEHPDKFLVKYLVKDFSFGFSLCYGGPDMDREADNLKSAGDNMPILQQKILKEVSLGRMAGPFNRKPWNRKIISPVGLVHKSGMTEHPSSPSAWRLIHDLSVPPGWSVNSYISKENASVTYKSFDEALEIVRSLSRGCWLAKSDLSSAFKRIPMDIHSLPLLGIKLDGQYFYNPTLPFGSKSSCQIFEKFLSALEWAIKNRTGMPLSHYLDDFLFVGATKERCQFSLDTFNNICKYINFPVALEKTVTPTQRLEFLGIEIDTVKMVLRVPETKINKVVNYLDNLLTRRHCKVWEIQVITGLLNFLTRAVHNVCCFIRRIYDLIKGHPQHHHIQITSGAKKDMLMWKRFLADFRCLRPIPTFNFVTNNDLDFFTDSSTKLGNGFGIVFKNSWSFGVWDSQFLAHKLSIELLELYPIVQAGETELKINMLLYILTIWLVVRWWIPRLLGAACV